MSSPTEGSRNLIPILVPELMGGMVAWFLFGINVVQVYVYALSFPRDHKLIKFSVYGLFIVECFQTAVATAAPWALLCEGWGKESALTRVGWQDPFVPLLDGVVSGWVQLFYAWRIYILGRSKTWTAIALGILPIAALSSSMAIYSGVRIFPLHTTREVLALAKYVTVWVVASMVCDIIIAGCMAYILFSFRHRVVNAANQTTQKRITTLIRLSVETGCVTALSTVFQLVAFLSFKDTTLYIGFGLIISKVYSNSLMVSLNSRIYAKHNDKYSIDVSSHTDLSTQLPLSRPRMALAPEVYVNVSTSSETFGELRHKKLVYGQEDGIAMGDISEHSS